MKQIVLGQPFPGEGGFKTWVEEALREIERASNEDVEAVLAEFSVTGTLTESRTIDAGTATLADLRNFLATMVSDIQNRGQKRSYGS